MEYASEDSLTAMNRLVSVMASIDTPSSDTSDLCDSDLDFLEFYPYGRNTQLDSVFGNKYYNRTKCVESMFGVLVFVANLNQKNISLSLDTIVSIYLGQIQVWNDTKIQQDNPVIASSLPYKPITLVFRTEASGTSFNLVKYLTEMDPVRFKGYGNGLKISQLGLPSYRTLSDNQTVESNDRMMEVLYGLDGSLGYTSLSVYNNFMSTRDQNRMKLVNLVVNSTNVVQPSMANAKSTISKFSASNYKSSQLYALSMSIAKSNLNHYPLISPSFWCLSLYHTTLDEGGAVLDYIDHSYEVLRVTTGSAVVRQSSTKVYRNVVSVPSWLASSNMNYLNNNVYCTKEKVLCSKIITVTPVPTLEITLSIIGAMAFCLIILVISIVIYCIYRRRQTKTPTQLNQQLLDYDGLDNTEGPPTDASVLTYSAKLFEFDQLKSTIKAEELSLDEQIGSGSFSEVYKGRWLGATVAVKRFMVNHHIETDEVVQDFVKESKLMSKLRHPNIVQFMGVCIQMPHLYMVTEFCERGNLQHILRDKKIKLSLRKTLSMAADAARGMFYLHSSTPPIIHRDFKSANLLVDKNWCVKVGDFGMSRMIDSQQQMTVCGTAETCAPEVLKRNMYTEKADVYSFGIVLWEMFTRNQLYVGLNFYELSSRVVNEGLRPDTTGPRFQEEIIPKAIIDLMKQCWDDDPNVRPDFGTVLNILEDELEIETERAKK